MEFLGISGCPGFGRSFVSNFGPRSGAHVSGTGACSRKRKFQTQRKKTSLQTCPFSLTANTMHVTWIFEISCYYVDVNCVPLCLPLLPSIHVPSRACSTCCVQSDPVGSLQQMRHQPWLDILLVQKPSKNVVGALVISMRVSR